MVRMMRKLACGAVAASVLAVAALLAEPAFAQPSGVIPQSTPAVASSFIPNLNAKTVFNWQVTATAAGYVLVFDSLTVPADGAVSPKKCYALAANATLGVGLQLTPEYFQNGAVFVYSSTGCFTKTASATAFFSVDGS